MILERDPLFQWRLLDTKKLDDLLVLAEQRLDILRATLLAHDLFATNVEDVETILDQVRQELGI